MAESEVDLDQMMRGMVTDTEKEIYQYAVTGKDEPDADEPDENPDRSIEEMGEGLEGQHEPDEDEGDDEEKAGDEPDKLAAKDAEDKSDEQPRDDKGKFAEKADDKGESDKDQKPGQPPSRVLAEANERRRAAEERIAAIEAERKAEREAAQNELRMLHAKIDGFMAATKQPAKAEEPKQAEPVDLFENPQGFVTQLREGIKAELARDMGQTVQQLAAQQRVEMSLQFAASKHGDAFGKAFEEVSKLDPKNPEDQMTVRRIWSSPNPGERLVEWHRERELLREVGSDPTAYKQKLANETREALMKDPDFRKQLLEELKAEATGAKGGRPRAEFRPPKSLNGASGGRSEVADPALYDNSDASVFAHALADEPR